MHCQSIYQWCSGVAFSEVQAKKAVTCGSDYGWYQVIVDVDSFVRDRSHAINAQPDGPIDGTIASEGEGIFGLL